MREVACDVAIIGGGPGGSTSALYLLRHGYRAVILEKERFPRFHIGESLLPWNLEIFDDLGIHDDIRKAGFIVKHGAEFVSACGDHVRKFHFRNGLVKGQPLAYQVLRSEFDHLLLRRARDQGADVREESLVSDAAQDPDAWRLKVTPKEGDPYVLKARMLVDASGQNTFLSSRLRLKRIDPEHQRYAVFGHFHGVERGQGEDAGNIRIIPFGEGHWFWFIPLADDVTSIGAVVTKETVREHRDDLEKYLLDRIRETPSVHATMAKATLAWPVHTLSDFSYASSQFAGDRFVLVGDAAAFLDPVFSSGVLMAMSSARTAAAAIAKALGRDDLGRHAFRSYERAQRAQIAMYFRLIRAYYRPEYLQMFMNPSTRMGLQPAVITLLAGLTRHGLGMRARLELFYLIGRILKRTPANRRHQLTCSHGCSVHKHA